MHTMLRSLVMVAVMLTTIAGMDAQRKENPVEQMVFYRTVKVDGLSIFYRELGRRMLPRFFCCMVCRLRRGCFSRY